MTLRHAQRFELQQRAVHSWRAESPRYTSGWLLVLQVDRDLVFPREMAEPVLYVGDQTAERVNRGAESGQVVAIVPGDMPLTEAEMFFGDPAMPERVDAGRIARERARARAEGVRPPSPGAVRAATRAALQLGAQQDLHRAAIELVARYSPQERDLIDGARVPQAR